MRLSPGRRFAVLVWAGSSAFFLVLGAVGHATLSTADFVATYHEPAGFLGYWSHWDGAWFDHIAQNGYDSKLATAFFPLFPIALRGMSVIGVGLTLGGILVSLAAGLLTCVFLYDIGERLFGDRIARVAVVLFALFPTALFMVAAYSEALFLCLSAGCLWAIYVRRDLVVAGAFAYLAAVTRTVGVFLVIPLAIEWYRNRKEYGAPSLLGVVAPVFGLLTYMGFLWRIAREPFLFTLAYERGWGRTRAFPVTTVVHGYHRAGDGLAYAAHPWRLFETTSVNPPFLLSNTLNFGFCVVMLVLLVLAFVRLPFGLALYSVPLIVAPLTVASGELPLVSFPRYALSAAPLFFVLAGLLARRTALLGVWLVASVALGVVLTFEFVTWRWVA